MEGADKYPRWVGVLLSLCFPGAGQYFSGAKKRGVRWFVTLFLGLGLVLFLLAESSVRSLIPAVVAAGLLVLLWLGMLWDSRRPVERLDLLTLGAVLACGIIFQYLGLWFWARFEAQVLIASSNAMAPTLQQQLRPGQTPRADVFVVQRWAYWFGKPRRGDIILFRTEGLSSDLPRGNMVLRVIALPKDKLTFEGGRVAIDGKVVTSPPEFNSLRYKLPANGPFLNSAGMSYSVPEDRYIVFADNSTELFMWGPVPPANILGRVSRVCWPLDRLVTFP